MHTLFLVDDNTVDQFIMMTVLKKNPIFENIKRFDSGESIIKYIQNNKKHLEDLPDVIFLDLSMPQFDGWDVLEALNNEYESLIKKLIVYIISASIDKNDRAKAFTFPFVKNFFSKPITSANFVLISSDLESFWRSQKLKS
ncbi:response regulator [Mucilaginibacter sp.]